jgi:hypothetical protein
LSIWIGHTFFLFFLVLRRFIFYSHHIVNIPVSSALLLPLCLPSQITHKVDALWLHDDKPLWVLCSPFPQLLSICAPKSLLCFETTVRWSVCCAYVLPPISLTAMPS